MDNAVVVAVAAALARRGVAALRFNFGGVGGRPSAPRCATCRRR
jgi:alpha/beta superfamily hydrolase